MPRRARSVYLCERGRANEARRAVCEGRRRGKQIYNRPNFRFKTDVLSTRVFRFCWQEKSVVRQVAKWQVTLLGIKLLSSQLYPSSNDAQAHARDQILTHSGIVFGSDAIKDLEPMPKRNLEIRIRFLFSFLITQKHQHTHQRTEQRTLGDEQPNVRVEHPSIAITSRAYIY